MNREPGGDLAVLDSALSLHSSNRGSGPRPWRFERLALERPAGHWLHVLEAGLAPESGAPTVLLIHGAGGSWHNYRLQIQWLQQSYRVLSLDLRGHGLSPWPGPSRVEDFVADLEELVARKVTGPMAVMGHSFGGCLAAHLAVRLPDRVRGLALCNTSGHIPASPVYRVLRRFSRFSHWVAQIEPYWISCHGKVTHQLLWNTLPGWNTWELFAQIRVPCLVLCGKHDLLVPWADSERMARLLPQARYHRIEEGRHVCMWESPKVVREQWEGWLSELQWS